MMLQITSQLQQWIYCWFWNFSSKFTLCCVLANVPKSKTFNYFVCTDSPKSSTDADLSVTCGYTRKILHRRNGHLFVPQQHPCTNKPSKWELSKSRGVAGKCAESSEPIELS